MARGVLIALLSVAAADADAARLKTDATLHARPSASSDVVGQVPAGTRVEVLSESGGWHEVKAPEGQGFVRSDQLVLGESGEKPAKVTEKKPEDRNPEERKAEEKKPEERRPAAPETVRVPADDLRQLGDEVRLLRERPEPATAADLQRVEQTLTQAIAALGDRAAAPAAPATPVAPLPDTSLESVLAVSPVLLLVGAAIGWVAGRVTQRRRDNRNRIRV